MADIDDSPRELSSLDVALFLARNLKILLIAPLLGGLVALGVCFVLPPTFTATARILPPAQQQGPSAALNAQLGALAGLVGGAAGIKSPADQYAALLKSRTVYDGLIKRFDLLRVYDERYLDDARRDLAKRTTVHASPKDGMISIEVDDRDPRRAADLANGFVDELRKLTNTLAVTEAAQRRAFFEAQLKQAKDNLARSEVDLRRGGVGEAALKTVPQSALEAIARLRAQITAQEIRLAAMRTSMTEENPELRTGLRELAALHAELAKIEETRAVKDSGQGAEYITRYRDFKYYELLFELMAKQYELARLDEAREGAVVQVVDVALPPERKSKPRKLLVVLLSAFGSLVVAMIAVLARESLRAAEADPAAAAKLATLRSLLRRRG